MSTQTTTLTYKCPNCGAPLKFSSETQNWACEFCLSTFSEEELKVTQSTEETGIPAPEAVPAGEGSPENLPHIPAGTTVYHCPNCGADMITNKGTAASFCAYCGSPAIFPETLSGDFAPEKILPFRYDRKEALEALEQLCKKKPLLPPDFHRSHHIEKVTGIYVPFWLFDWKMDVDLSASCQKVSTWSDSRYRYTKTDHYQVERKGVLTVEGVPTDGLQRMDDSMMDALEPFDYDALCDFSFSYLSGYFAERYDVDKDASWARAKARMEPTARQLAEQSINNYTGRQLRHFSIADREKEGHYAMLPVWLLSTQYRGQNYLLAMNGQSGKMVGKLPMSWGQLAKYAGKWGGIAFLITLIGGMLLC